MDGTINSIDMSLSKFWERVKDREAWHTAVHGLAESGTIARACVQPLVGELRSHNPQGTAKKKSGSIDLLVEMALLLDTL